MLLFRRQAGGRPVFFSRGLEEQARMVIDGEQVELSRVSVSGPSFAGLHARQTHSYGSYSIEVDVRIEQTPRVLDGAEIRQGRLRVRDASGWSFVMPVAGLVACQTDRTG